MHSVMWWGGSHIGVHLRRNFLFKNWATTHQGSKVGRGTMKPNSEEHRL